jgi:hypothetical protein
MKDSTTIPILVIMATDHHRWPAYNGTDDTSILLHDLSGLAQSSKVHITRSTIVTTHHTT